MAIVKVIMKCDVCGHGVDASKAVNIMSTDIKGRIIGSIDVCSDCRRVISELLEWVKAEQKKS